MRKTIDLLNEMVEMGFDREEALEQIDVVLDKELENRQPLMEEEITKELYENIKHGFLCEIESEQMFKEIQEEIVKDTAEKFTDNMMKTLRL